MNKEAREIVTRMLAYELLWGATSEMSGEELRAFSEKLTQKIGEALKDKGYLIVDNLVRGA